MAFFAIVSIGTVGLYIAYAIPIYLRIRSKTFQEGPWNLGALSKAIGWIAVLWVVLITLLFFAPQFYPFLGFANVNNFNWAGPVFIVLLAAIGLWWVLSARKWFKGPIVQGDETKLEELEMDLGEPI